MLLSARERNPFRRALPRGRARRHRPAWRVSRRRRGGVSCAYEGSSGRRNKNQIKGHLEGRRPVLPRPRRQRRGQQRQVELLPRRHLGQGHGDGPEEVRPAPCSAARAAARYPFLSCRLVSLWDWSLPAQQPIFCQREYYFLIRDAATRRIRAGLKEKETLKLRYGASASADFDEALCDVFEEAHTRGNRARTSSDGYFRNLIRLG